MFCLWKIGESGLGGCESSLSFSVAEEVKAISTTENPNQEPSKRASSPNSGQPKRLPRWLAYPLALIVWGVVPWAISLLTPHYGWVAGYPGPWNLLGLIPVVVGITGLLWTLGLHFAQAPQGVEWNLTQSFLLTRGPYAYSRHPMYLSELTLLFGWAIFYGSLAVLIAFAVWCAFFNFFAVPREERALEARYGEAYREYKNKVPRWLGKTRG